MTIIMIIHQPSNSQPFCFCSMVEIIFWVAIVCHCGFVVWQSLRCLLNHTKTSTWKLSESADWNFEQFPLRRYSLFTLIDDVCLFRAYNGRVTCQRNRSMLFFTGWALVEGWPISGPELSWFQLLPGVLKKHLSQFWWKHQQEMDYRWT